jgi:tripartite-type tricarboxylate transporter receptor subunit TctC
VENKAGGGMTIGTDIVARSPADGYMLVIIANAHAVNPAIMKKVPFDSVKDFTPLLPKLISKAPLNRGNVPNRAVNAMASA